MKHVQNLLERYWRPLDSGFRKFLLFVFGALVVLVIALASLSQPSGQVVTNQVWQPQPVSSAVATNGTKLTMKLIVHVVGAIKQPGVYEVESGARVMDAIFAAGGFLPAADQASINLARPLNDGEQIIVLSVGQSDASEGTGKPNLVNPNTANASELDSLPGIGPTLAARIIDYRNSNGSFSSIADLAKVAGIGPNLISKIKALVTF